MAVEAMLLSPLPRKACSWPREPFDSAHHSLAETEATDELRVMLAWKSSFETPCSSASTDAGSITAASLSPPLPSLSPALSCTSPLPPISFEGAETVCCADRTADSPSPDQQCGTTKSSWLRARKIFVGGIPQTWDQNDLCSTLSHYGKITKAWLQYFPADGRAGPLPADRKHRGFGFVIFHEKHAVEELLGDRESRFLQCRDACRLEVKRAVGKITGRSVDQRQAGGSLQQDPRVRLSPDFSGSQQHSSSEVPQRSSQKIHWRADTVQCYTLSSLPQLPPFPLQDPRTIQQSRPEVEVSRTLSLNALTPPAVSTPAPGDSFLPRSLFDGFVGKKPCNRQELAELLLQAMPEHYED